ncbi:MAG: hypothetical protein Q8K19_08830, partial [Methylicorpusculum sp.]|uniref:hypothetical protein n=1 Tax=Methylicorpusculum sp. TaxID=2713644 RepID=UPI002731BF44
PIPGFRPSGQLKLFKIVPADFVFACPKKSIQKKRHPEAAASCALTILPRVFGWAIPSPPKTSGIPAAPQRAILGKIASARRGLTGPREGRLELSQIDDAF